MCVCPASRNFGTAARAHEPPKARAPSQSAHAVALARSGGGWLCDRQRGEMAEWFKAAVLKTAVGASSPWVRIPLSPPPRRAGPFPLPRNSAVPVARRDCYARAVEPETLAPQTPAADPITRQPRGKGRRLRGAIAHKLGVAILSGEFAPGETLSSEVVFAETLDVSRSAYREAIQVLIQNSGDEIPYSQGTPVTVHLPPEALRVLQDTGERHEPEKDPPPPAKLPA